jgi:predicted enzyme related to lactoylglutathione lyase
MELTAQAGTSLRASPSPRASPSRRSSPTDQEGPVVHWELWSEDPAKVADFYTKVFDWKIQHVPDLNYHLADTGGKGGINGGIMKPQKGPWPGNLTFYIDVDDLDAYAKKITAAGGKMIVEKMKVPGVGELSLFEDTDGRVLGMWKQGA